MLRFPDFVSKVVRLSVLRRASTVSATSCPQFMIHTRTHKNYPFLKWVILCWMITLICTFITIYYLDLIRFAISFIFSQIEGNIQSDSKWWTQLKSKWHLNTRQTVGCGIPSSPLALRIDVRGLRPKLSWIPLTFSSDTHKKSCAS